MKNSQLIKTIIRGGQKKVYMSDSVAIKTTFTQTTFASLVFMIPLLVYVFVTHGDCIAQLSIHFFNSVPDNYSAGQGVLIEKEKVYRRPCRGTLKVDGHPYFGYVKTHHLSCSAKKGAVIRFVYPNDNPLNIVITDEHANFSDLIIVFACIGLLCGFLFLHAFCLVIFYIKFLKAVKTPDAGPLTLKLEKYENFYGQNMATPRGPLTMISELGPGRKRLRRLLRILFAPAYFEFSESGCNTLIIRRKHEVSHIYGISVNELKKFAGLRVVSPSGNKPERMIYFAGPWISPDKRPDENMNIWFTESRGYDYFVKPLKQKGNSLLHTEHADRKNNTAN